MYFYLKSLEDVRINWRKTFFNLIGQLLELKSSMHYSIDIGFEPQIVSSSRHLDGSVLDLRFSISAGRLTAASSEKLDLGLRKFPR